MNPQRKDTSNVELGETIVEEDCVCHSEGIFNSAAFNERHRKYYLLKETPLKRTACDEQVSPDDGPELSQRVCQYRFEKRSSILKLQ